jgi:hypothetical protein
MMARVALAMVLAACTLACITPTQRREDDLIHDARAWNDDFRWARWDIVGQSLPPEEGILFQERRNLVGDDLVIADYEVTSVRFVQGSRAAMVDVTLQWYRKTDPTVRQATLRQRWEVRSGRWMMIKQRRARGDRFPLVPEQIEEKSPSPAPGSAPE